jgi:hypothetical protein
VTRCALRAIPIPRLRSTPLQESRRRISRRRRYVRATACLSLEPPSIKGLSVLIGDTIDKVLTAYNISSDLTKTRPENSVYN